MKRDFNVPCLICKRTYGHGHYGPKYTCGGPDGKYDLNVTTVFVADPSYVPPKPKRPAPVPPKPTLQTLQYIDYHDMIHYIEKKHRFNVRDMGALERYRLKYSKHPEDVYEEPYLDFWHWLLDMFDNEFYNGAFKTLYVEDWLYDASQNPGAKKEEGTRFEKDFYPDYVLEVLNLIKSEGFLNEKGEVNVHVWW
jgi:hypothetical protein